MSAIDQTSGPHHAAEHSATLRLVLVWVALAGLTVATLLLRAAPLGSVAHVVVALAIAVTKSTLVILFFMELYHHHGAPRFVLAVSTLFLVTLIVIAIADLKTRFPPAAPNADLSPPQSRP